jgi:hypothetical protein
LFPIHASRINDIAKRSNANVQERPPGSGKNLLLTLITGLTSEIARNLGEVETLNTGKTGERAGRSMWNITAYSRKSAGTDAKAALQRWTHQILFWT